MRTETINTTDENVYKTEANLLLNDGFIQETVNVFKKSEVEIQFVATFIKHYENGDTPYCGQFGNHKCKLANSDGKCLAVSCRRQVVRRIL